MRKAWVLILITLATKLQKMNLPAAQSVDTFQFWFKSDNINGHYT